MRAFVCACVTLVFMLIHSVLMYRQMTTGIDAWKVVIFAHSAALLMLVVCVSSLNTGRGFQYTGICSFILYYIVCMFNDLGLIAEPQSMLLYYDIGGALLFGIAVFNYFKNKSLWVA